MEDVDRLLDRYIRLVLRAGMLLSVMVMFAGLVVVILSPGPVDSLPIEHLPGELMSGSPVAIIALGILLLIITPLARVIAAAVVFAVDREYLFVAASLAVLAVIALAIAV